MRGDLRAPQGPRPRTAVIICHGFKGFKDWGFFPPLARAIARRGHAALSFDFSRNGVGADGIDFSALDLFAENSHTRNVDEIRLVVEATQDGQLFPSPPERIALLGHSRGGTEAILAAAEDDRVNALVTWAAVAALGRRWSPEQIATWERGDTVFIPNARTGQQMPMGPAYWRDIVENGERLDVGNAVTRLTCPWLIVHGDEDETVSVDDAHTLFASAGEEKSELRIVEGGSHTFGAVHPFMGPTPQLQEAVSTTLDWLDRTLG
jgi:uncharacterized protein